MKKHDQNLLILIEKEMSLHSVDRTNNNNFLNHCYDSYANLEMALDEFKNSMDEFKINKSPQKKLSGLILKEAFGINNLIALMNSGVSDM